MVEDTIYIVDDDESVRDSLEALLDANGFRTASFDTAEAFLEGQTPDLRGCLLVDVRMPGLSGIELQKILAEQETELRVIVMSGHGDIPTAVSAIQTGAVDFIEKPYSGERLIECVRRALALGREEREAAEGRDEASERLHRLTPREREVFDLLVKGGSNKEIARDLDLSPRTVEVHRARVFDKMQAGNLAELIRQAYVAGVAED